MAKTILVMFGGQSAEHEVSVVTGLQTLERVPREQYEPAALYVDKDGRPWLLPGLSTRKGFFSGKRELVSFGKDEKGGFIQTGGLLGKKIHPYAAYLCFHGGTGEAGPIEGLLESFGIPHTGPSQESAVITMNKALTSSLMREEDIVVVPSEVVFARDISANSEAIAKNISQNIGLPTIVKPAHLGSSIGIAIAKTEIELEKALIEAERLDSEIVIEKFLPNITEYNIAVRSIEGNIGTSEIERPLSKDEILSFADKYQRGGKKTGNGAGMASLSRELPAKISSELKLQIEDTAKKAYRAARCTGMVRIDFMVSGAVGTGYLQDSRYPVPTAEPQLYLTEINPIPGSMAFYLWEASGIPFELQIAESIEEAVRERKEIDSKKLDYQTDIIEKFVGGI